MSRKEDLPAGRSRAEWLPSEHGSEQGSMQRRVARGLTWTLIDTWGTQLLGLAIFAVLANLLLPIDFGLVALAAVFVSLGQLLADQGLGDAVIQRSRLTRSQMNTAFVAAVLTGLMLTLIGVVSAPFIASLVGEERLTPILQVLSISFTFTGLASIHMSLLRREMRFRSLAIRKLLAVGIGGVVGVWMAFSDFGAWALVGQQVTGAAVTVIALWAVTPWRPGLSFSGEDFRSLFAFGIRVVAGDLLLFVSRNTDRLLIGIFLGPVALGFYAVAFRILDTSQQLLVAATRRLAFPSFSRLQHDMARFRRGYLRMVRASSVLILPGYVGLALVAHEAIIVLFGHQWEQSAVVASILFLVGPAVTLQSNTSAVFDSLGRPDVTLRYRVLTAATNVVGFVLAVTIFGDIVWVAVAYTARGYLLLPLQLIWTRRYVGIPIRDQLLPVRGVALATILMAVAVLAVKFGLADLTSNSVLLVIQIAVGVATFGLALLLIERPLVRELLGLGIQVLPGGERVAARLGVERLAGARSPLPGARRTIDDYVEEG